MRFGDHTDAELVRRAQDGWAPAFAVLVNRHAPALRAALAEDEDPLGGVIEVFVRAMRRLDRLDPDEPVLSWLLELAKVPAAPREAVVPLSQEEQDEVWAELALRWPTGRVPFRIPRAVRLTGLAVVLVLLAALIPTVLLADNGRGEDEPQIVEELQAFPLEEEDEVDEEDVEVDEPEVDDGFDFEGLPTFDFPEEEATQAEEAPAAEETSESPDEEPTEDEPADEPGEDEGDDEVSEDENGDEELEPDEPDDGDDDGDDGDAEGDGGDATDDNGQAEGAEGSE